MDNVVWDKAEVIRDDDELYLDFFLLGSVVVLLHVAVKYFEQFVVYCVKIGTDDDAVFVVFYRNDVDYIFKNVVPQIFRVAPEQRHVDLVVDVAYFVSIRLLLYVCRDFFFVPESVGVENIQHL